MHQASGLEVPAAFGGDNRLVAEELHNPQPGPGPGQLQAWMRAVEYVSDCRPS